VGTRALVLDECEGGAGALVLDECEGGAGADRRQGMKIGLAKITINTSA
jgi:hypothetical protein